MMETDDTITVHVNGRPLKLYRGMQVKHALISFDQAFYEAAQEGAVFVEDENGYQIGLEGALKDGARIRIVGKHFQR